MCFYGEALLAPRPTPKLKDHPLSAVRDCLFNLFAATLNIRGRSSIRNLRTPHAVVRGTHLSDGNSNQHNLNLFYHILPSNIKTNHPRNFNFFVLHTLGKYKIKLFQIIFLVVWRYGCTTHHSPGMNRKIWGYKAHFASLPRALWFLRLFTLYVRSGRQCASVLQVGTHVYKTHNSALWKITSNSACRREKNVLLLRNVAWYSLVVASTCNLLNRTYILTANLSYTNKITKIHFKFQNSKHKPNVSFSLSTHYNNNLVQLIQCYAEK